MNSLRLFLYSVCLLTLAMVTVLPAQVRTWTDRNGKQIRAEYMSVAGQTVWIRKTDGSRMKVPWQSLSDHDQEWIKGMLEVSSSSLEAMGLTLNKDLPAASTTPAARPAAPPQPTGLESDRSSPEQPAGNVNLDTGYKDTYGLPDDPEESSEKTPSQETTAESMPGKTFETKSLIIPGAAAGVIVLVVIIAAASSGSRKKR